MPKLRVNNFSVSLDGYANVLIGNGSSGFAPPELV